MADRPASIAAVLTALDDPHLSFTILAELQFADGTVNIWLGPKDETFSYISKTWTGTGQIGTIETIKEIEGISEEVVICTLTATKAMIDTIELVNNEGKKATFYILIFNKDTRVIIGHIETRREMGAAWIEPKIVKEAGAELLISEIKMEFTGEGQIMARKFVRRLTYTDGLDIDPNDHFLEFIGDPDMGRQDHGSLQIKTGPPTTNPLLPGEIQIR